MAKQQVKNGKNQQAAKGQMAQQATKAQPTAQKAEQVSQPKSSDNQMDKETPLIEDDMSPADILKEVVHTALENVEDVIIEEVAEKLHIPLEDMKPSEVTTEPIDMSDTIPEIKEDDDESHVLENYKSPHTGLTKEGKPDMRGGNRSESYSGDLYYEKDYKAKKAAQIAANANLPTETIEKPAEQESDIVEPTEDKIDNAEINEPSEDKTDRRGENQFTKDPEYHQRREDNKAKQIAANAQPNPIQPNLVTRTDKPATLEKPRFTSLADLQHIPNKDNTPEQPKLKQDGTPDKRAENPGNPALLKGKKAQEIKQPEPVASVNHVQTRLRGYSDTGSTIELGYVPTKEEHVVENRLQGGDKDPARCAKVHLNTIIYLTLGISDFKQVKLDKNSWAIITPLTTPIGEMVIKNEKWPLLEAFGFSFDPKERVGSYYRANANPEALAQLDVDIRKEVYDKLVEAAEISHKFNAKNNQFTSTSNQKSSWLLELNRVVEATNALIPADEQIEATLPEESAQSEVPDNIDTETLEEEIKE